MVVRRVVSDLVEEEVGILDALEVENAGRRARRQQVMKRFTSGFFRAPHRPGVERGELLLLTLLCIEIKVGRSFVLAVVRALESRRLIRGYRVVAVPAEELTARQRK